MKRHVCLTLVLLLLVSVAPAVQGQQPRRFTADTGVVTLGPNQGLRVTIAGGTGDADLYVRFTRMAFAQGACNDGVCQNSLASQTTSGPIQVSAGEAVYADFNGAPVGTRIVASSTRLARVTVQVIDILTGDVVAVSHPPMEHVLQ